MNILFSTPLKGIIVPLVTPLLDRDILDREGLERLIEHILAGGVHGLFILGTTGEAPSLGYRLRYELIERTCAQVAGRVPVLVGITDTAFVESVALARKAKDAGAQAVLLAPPYYFHAGQPEILEYLAHIVPELPLPLFLYNTPSHTKLIFEPDTVRVLAANPGIVGLKDSSADMVYFHQLQTLLKDKPDFSLLIGTEELLGEAVLMGGHGGICGGANLWPQLFVNLYNAAKAKDLPAVAALQEKVLQVSSTLYKVGHYRSSYIKGLKCALSCIGICSDFTAEPFHRFREKERAVIRRHVETLGIVGEPEVVTGSA
ncbi:dihydrodipicolinate synthase family protein [Candidatus Neomarinimicrobiota bacterium]